MIALRLLDEVRHDAHLGGGFGLLDDLSKLSKLGANVGHPAVEGRLRDARVAAGHNSGVAGPKNVAEAPRDRRG